MSKPMSAEERARQVVLPSIILGAEVCADLRAAIAAAIQQAQAEERERCAKVAETAFDSDDSELFAEAGREIASAIRSLTQTREAPDAE